MPQWKKQKWDFKTLKLRKLLRYQTCRPGFRRHWKRKIAWLMTWICNVINSKLKRRDSTPLPQSTLLANKTQQLLNKRLKKSLKRSRMPCWMKKAGRMRKNKRKRKKRQRRSGGTFKTRLSSTYPTSFVSGVTLTLKQPKTSKRWSKLLMLLLRPNTGNWHTVPTRRKDLKKQLRRLWLMLANSLTHRLRKW